MRCGDPGTLGRAILILGLALSLKHSGNQDKRGCIVTEMNGIAQKRNMSTWLQPDKKCFLLSIIKSTSRFLPGCVQEKSWLSSTNLSGDKISAVPHQVKDERNANGCGGPGTVTSQTDLCFPDLIYTVYKITSMQQIQERSPAENIQWPFGYFGISHKSSA